MAVHRELGCGFLEAVYQEALEIEFQHLNIPYVREASIAIDYRGQSLKQKYYADFICYGNIIIELKAVEQLCSQHEAQVINYLEATKYKLGLLVNFGDISLRHKRLVRNIN